jgi:hypothetical protein
MRYVRLLAALVCVAGAGCFLSNRPDVPTIVRSLTPPLPVEGLVVESVLIEQPLGDAFLDRELWASLLPVGVAESRALLDENGLRLGIVAGSGPQKFQTLLNSETDTVSPQRFTFHMRKETVVPTAGPIDPCKFVIRGDLAGKPETVELQQARCGILVRPQLASDGRVKLRVEPRIQHGDRQQWFRPNEDATQLAKYDEVPTEKYPVLGCEVLLNPDDYLVMGWDTTATNSIGSVLFTAEVDGRPRQRILVVRARPASPAASDLPPLWSTRQRPAIAAQAAGKK